ncbi:glycerophosphodiester phosphodiesterase [soil metagenome]
MLFPARPPVLISLARRSGWLNRCASVPEVHPIAFAHRGFSPEGAENSMAAFRAAVDLGYRYLETDARVSSDGVAVAFHDDVLDRVTNDTGRLHDLTWRQISTARIQAREPIPRLDEVLAAFPEVHVNIDVKSDAAVGPTLDALRRTDSWDRVRLAAFSHRRIMMLRSAAGPRVATSLSPNEILALRSESLARRWAARPVSLLARGAELLPTGDPQLFGPTDRPRAAQVPAGPRWLALVDRAFLDNAHRRGIDVHVWTVNDPAQMMRLLDLGVDGIMTDRADLLRDVLTRRGQWL